VISGDTSATEAIARACHGCDVLLHEVYSPTEASTSRAKERPKWPEYLKKFHTSTEELAAIADKAQPKLLVLYHQIYGTTDDAELVREVEKTYRGRVVSAKDLDVY
jgi:ribonuclease BN (tRNA processing enzyme)